MFCVGGLESVKLERRLLSTTIRPSVLLLEIACKMLAPPYYVIPGKFFGDVVRMFADAIRWLVMTSKRGSSADVKSLCSRALKTIEFLKREPEDIEAERIKWSSIFESSSYSLRASSSSSSSSFSSFSEIKEKADSRWTRKTTISPTSASVVIVTS